MTLNKTTLIGKTELVAIHGECDRKNRFYKIADYTEEELEAIVEQLPPIFIMLITR